MMRPWALSCLTLILAAGAPHNPAPPALPATQVCGAWLRDDFDSGAWGHPWSGPWIQDKNLRISCEEGRLRVSGVTGAPVSECATHHEFRFTGLVSRPLPVRDGVLACEMHVRAPLPTGATRARYLVHLCGAAPDYFADTGVSHEPDGREGWFHAPIAEGFPISHDHPWPFESLERIPLDREYTVVIEHNAESKETSGRLFDGSQWFELGAHRIYLSSTQVELKVDTPYDGVKVDVCYDNVRLYSRPASAPMRVALIRPPFPGYPLADAAVTLRDIHGELVASGQTSRDGEATLTLPSDRLYPIGGVFEVHHKGILAGRSEVSTEGVQGIYPGDVWKVHLPETFRVEGGGYPLGM